jgi:hypothetical protein
MWIMTPFGILMPAALPEKIREEFTREWNATPDLEYLIVAWDLQVRTRDKRALTYLRKRYMRGTLGPTIATPEMDYDFRAYCSAVDFASAVSLMILEIDYEKFKPETERFKWGRDLHGLYNKIWGVVFTHYDRSTPKPPERKRWWEDVRP